jgi:hypothetical protein
VTYCASLHRVAGALVQCREPDRDPLPSAPDSLLDGFTQLLPEIRTEV